MSRKRCGAPRSICRSAVERDPEFALAHATLSFVSMNIHFEFDPQRTWLQRAEDHCRLALALDPMLPEGHLARAWILWSPAKNFQHAEAIAALEQVLAARPNLERAHNRMASICLHIGRLEEARIAHEQALRSNPRTRTGNLEYFYIFSGDFARAEEAVEAWFRERPGSMSALVTRTLPPLLRGNLELAEQRLATALNSSRTSPCSSPFKACCTPGAVKPTPHWSVFVRRWIPRVPSATRTTPTTTLPASMRYSGHGQGDGVARTERRHRVSVLAVLPDRSPSRKPARRARIHTTRR